MSRINVDTDLRLHNPFKDIETFAKWFTHQRHLKYLLNDLDDAGMVLCSGIGNTELLDVYDDYFKNSRVLEPVFVFGSNLAGRHGAGAAKLAKEHYGASHTVGEGRSGNSYAIPTKDADLGILTLEEIATHVEKFIKYAITTNDTFNVTRVGCGLAGYRDSQIAPYFLSNLTKYDTASTNCNVKLPYHWLKDTPTQIAITGSRGLDGEGVYNHLDRVLPIYKPSVINVGAARGVDRVAEQYCVDHAIPFVRHPARWERFGKIAGYIRNETMLNCSNLVVGIWDGQSRGTKNMIELSNRAGVDLVLRFGVD